MSDPKKPVQEVIEDPENLEDPEDQETEGPEAPSNGKNREEHEDNRPNTRKIPTEPITLPETALSEYQYMIDVIGETYIISHSKKGLKEELAKPKLPKGHTKPPFDDVAHFKDSLYLLPDKSMPTEKIVPSEEVTKESCWGFYENTFGTPAKAFKDAVIRIIGEERGIQMAFLKRRIRVIGTGVDPNMAVLRYEKLHAWSLCLPNPSNKSGGKMPTCRGRFFKWKASLIFTVPKTIIAPKDFLGMFLLAGTYIGAGDGRKEKSGYEVGTFGIDCKEVVLLDRSEAIKKFLK